MAEHGQFDDACEDSSTTHAARKLGAGVTALPKPAPVPSKPKAAAPQPKQAPPTKAQVVTMSPNAKCGDRGDGRAGIESDEEFEENFDEKYNDDELLVGAGFVRQGGLGLSLEKKLASGKMNFSQRTANDMVSSEKASSKQPKHQGRDDRATSEQVMDPRTRLMLFKMLNSGFLSDIDGCLSTGKEANGYYAS